MTTHTAYQHQIRVLGDNELNYMSERDFLHDDCSLEYPFASLEEAKAGLEQSVRETLKELYEAEIVTFSTDAKDYNNGFWFNVEVEQTNADDSSITRFMVSGRALIRSASFKVA